MVKSLMKDFSLPVLSNRTVFWLMGTA